MIPVRLVGGVRSAVTGLEPIWHVIIGGEQRGPLTEDQVLAYLGDGTLGGRLRLVSRLPRLEAGWRDR